MRIKIVVVGKVKESAFQNRITEYVKWVNKEIPVELIPLKDGKSKDVELKQLSHLSPNIFSICLSEEGNQVSSREFSKLIYKQTRDIVFLIGGPNGHSESIRKKTDYLLSFSKMTFPYEMALMVLTEQLFRAISIKKGSKYHRD